MTARVFVLIASIGGAAATFLPWQIDDRVIYDGWHASGTASFGAFLAAALCGAYRPVWFVRVALFFLGMVALGAAAKTVGEVGSIQRMLSSSFDAEGRRQAALHRVGTGAWLAIAAGIVLVFSAFLWKRPRPGAKPVELPKATVVRNERLAVASSHSSAPRAPRSADRPADRRTPRG